MYWTQYFIPTVKEIPADAIAASHQLMLRAGLIRQVALDRIAALEAEAPPEDSVPSIAIGDLGPPQLSKYLFELYLVRDVSGALEAAVEALAGEGADIKLAERLEENSELRDLITSVGIPILLPDGVTILRGPEIKIPGYDAALDPRVLGAEEIDAYASKGWVDLRAKHLRQWSIRLDRIVKSRRGGSAGASDAMGHEVYGRDDFRIGEVTAWIFANDPDFLGYRIK